MVENEWMRERLSESEILPTEIDTSTPSIARVYDYFLKGKDNFAADREVAEQIIEAAPEAAIAAESNRGVLRRAVRHLVADAGIRQFIDIGSGLPTQGNVHEVAHAIDPQARVVYVDNDPIVLAHGRALLAETDTTTVIQADIREPGQILDNPDTQALIDFTEPVGLLLAGIIHHVQDEEDPERIMARLRDALPSGSYVLLTHFFDPGDDPVAARFESIMQEGFETGRYRRRDEIEPFFDGLELLEPGLVHLHQWRPDPQEPEQEHYLQKYVVAGLACKP